MTAGRASDKGAKEYAHDEATIQFYTAEAPVYVASGVDRVNSRLGSFLARLPRGARILELGCGGGRDAQAMIAAGFDVEPTDGVSEIARRAEERLSRAVRVMRFDELDAESTYDAAWASASLLHVPRSALPGVLTRIFRALRPGGFHFSSYKSGGGEGRDGFGRYYNYPTREELEAAYRASADWEVVEVEEYQGGGYDDRQGPWLAITVRKPE